MIVFGSGDNAKGIKVRYLIVNASSPYNIIIERPTFNVLEASLPTLYLTMKYPLDDGRVGVIKGNQGLARIFYKDSLKLKKKIQQDHPMTKNPLKVNLIGLDPREDGEDDSLTLIGELKKVQITINDF